MFREMKPEKISDSNTEESSKGNSGILKVAVLKERNKTFTIKDTFSVKENTPRASLIPILRINNDNNEAKGVERKFAKSVKPSKLGSVSFYEKRGPYQKAVDKKSKLRDASCKSAKKKEETKNPTLSESERINQPNSADFARRMTSDPQVFGKTPLADGELVDFENCIRQISEMWLKTSMDLSNKLENLKNNPPLDPTDFQQEKIKIQLAIQQAKSLTVLKTESVMTEAQMLLHNEEGFRSKVEYFFCDKTPRSGKSGLFSGYGSESGENEKIGGMGDLARPMEKNDCNKETDADKDSGSLTTRIEKMDSFLFRKKDEMSRSQKDSDRTISLEKLSQEMLAELSKKNDTITALNNKIFQLQKNCEEHLQMRNQLQSKLAEYHEKVQWNHVLWKQIGKLKGRIKEFQESHEILESEKKGLEARVADQEKEIERLKKLNQLLNQKKFLLSERENHRGRKIGFVEELTNNKLVEEKRNSINVLKMVLNLMKDQENLAQKQIAVFQSKIEELEEATNIC